MNIPFLGKLAKKYPAIARTLELAIISCSVAFLAQLQQWTVDSTIIDWKLILSAFLIPVLGGLSKYLRDLEKDDTIGS
jgi:hypothetical protein